MAVSGVVIVADDSERLLERLSKRIGRAGFQTITFSSVDAACASIETLADEPAGALLDIWFPHRRLGFEIASALRTRFGDALPIAMMSGYPSDFCELAEKLGARVLDKGTTEFDSFVSGIAALHPVRDRPALHRTVLAITERYELTPQEARIVGQLASGTQRSLLPSALGISENTLKSQMRSLLRKTQLQATEELVSLILRTIGNVGETGGRSSRDRSPLNGDNEIDCRKSEHRSDARECVHDDANARDLHPRRV